MKEQPFNHLDADGKSRMVDVGHKSVTKRIAIAEGSLQVPESVIQKLSKLPKGNPIEVARIAGIMAAKRTSDLIPLCHPITLEKVQVDIRVEKAAIHVEATVQCQGKTGVEMEALTAVSATLLTLYDMLKSQSHDMTLSNISLLEKSGGKSGTYQKSRQ
ncbi:MAG: cyclic pyranopterin monophosphate synthase MoaC [Acidobacteria bacterium]|nr:cyclic pyranopterin monophosphate synthase MoaC [Acidobacteriota bacterium]MCB9397108.1 cyclic pyranopterin monophosphate synthase MoaC [Acidobacteriota bacterium]